MYVLYNAVQMFSNDDVTINGASICRFGFSFKIKCRLFRILAALNNNKILRIFEAIGQNSCLKRHISDLEPK